MVYQHPPEYNNMISCYNCNIKNGLLCWNIKDPNQKDGSIYILNVYFDKIPE